MPRIQITAAAQSDAERIAEWIATDSPLASENWLDDLQHEYEKIFDVPGTGTDRSEMDRGLRSSPFGSYLIFFRRLPHGIRIVRVFHGSRDYRKLFKR